jgi:glycosyltransferase involved in cell wall biosynthesis
MAGDRLRVLYLIGYLSQSGGAERFALGLAMGVPQDRFEPWMCFARKADEGPLQDLRAAGIPYVGLGRQSRLDFYRFAGLVRLLRRERFDILHAHMFGSNFWGTLIGRACGVPVVIAHEHTWAYKGNPIRRWLDGYVIGRLATRFVAVSQADAERMVSYEHVPPEKVVVMPTAYIPSRGATSSDVRAELGLSNGTPVIATAAILRPQKALDVMFEALALVRRRVPNIQLVLAGDGPARRPLEQRVRDLNLDAQVHFLGLRSDVDSILRAADIGALSSDFEGMPLFAFECVRAGRPLVATAVGALPALIDSGRSGGILVPPRDPPALAEALVELLGDPTRREELAAAGQERLASFTMERVTAQFAELYEQLRTEVAH